MSNEVVGTLEVGGRRYELRSGNTTIGRSNTCHLTIPDDSVAPHHATVECGDHPDNVFIFALSCASDTVLWRCKLKPMVRYHLQDGSQVALGQVELTFHAPATNEPRSYEPPASAVTAPPACGPARSLPRLPACPTTAQIPPDDIYDQPTQVNHLPDTPGRSSLSTSFNPFDQPTQIPTFENSPRPSPAIRRISCRNRAPFSLNRTNEWDPVFLEETQPPCSTEEIANSPRTDQQVAVSRTRANGDEDEMDSQNDVDLRSDDKAVPTDNESLLQDGEDDIFVSLPSPNQESATVDAASGTRDLPNRGEGDKTNVISSEDSGRASKDTDVATTSCTGRQSADSLVWDKSGEDALTAVPSPTLGVVLNTTLNSDDEMIGCSQPVSSPPTVNVTSQHCLMKSILLSKADKGGRGDVFEAESLEDVRQVVAASDSDATECYEVEETFESQSKFVSRSERVPAVVEETILADSDRTDSDVEEEAGFHVPKPVAVLAPIEAGPVLRDDAVEDSQSLLLVDDELENQEVQNPGNQKEKPGSQSESPGNQKKRNDKPESNKGDVLENHVDDEPAYHLSTQVDEENASETNSEVFVVESTQVLSLSPPRDFLRFEPSRADDWMVTGASTQVTSPFRLPNAPSETSSTSRRDGGASSHLSLSYRLPDAPSASVRVPTEPFSASRRERMDGDASSLPPQSSRLPGTPPARLLAPPDPPSTSGPDRVDEDGDLPLTQMTQQTQEFERLSLEMPATQDFHEQMVVEALHTAWQSDEETTFEGFSEMNRVSRSGNALVPEKKDKAPRAVRSNASNKENSLTSEGDLEVGVSTRPKRSRKPTWKVESAQKSSKKRETKSVKPKPSGNSGDETDSDVEQQLESLKQSSGGSSTPKTTGRLILRLGKPKAKRRRGVRRVVSSSSSDSDSVADVPAKNPSVNGSTRSSVSRPETGETCPGSGDETPSDVEETAPQIALAASHRVISTADWLTETEEIRFTGVATRTRGSDVFPKLLRKRNTRTMNVTFTGGIRPAHRNAVHELGGSITEVEDAGVLICDKVRRTVKLLSAVASGVAVVPSKWLTDCQKAKCWLASDGHTLRDKDAEARWHFRLDDSLRLARSSKLLQGYNVAVSPNVKPPPHDIFKIVELSGGVCVGTSPRVWPPNSLFISCPADKSSWPSVKERNVRILSVEFILIGVLQQKLDISSHLLRN